MLPQSIHYAKKGVFTVLTLFLSIYVFTILLTYTPNDPSWSQISSSIDHISNMGGAVGAWLSDLLYSFFGAAAWLLIVFCVFEAAMLWREHKLPVLGLRLMAYLFLLLALSGLCSAVGVFFAPASDSMWTTQMGRQALSFGGIVGFEVLRRLADILTISGAFVFLLIFSVVTITFAFDLRFYRYAQLFFRYFNRRKVASNDEIGLLDDWADEHGKNQLSSPNLTDSDATDEGVQVDEHGQLVLNLPQQQAGARTDDDYLAAVNKVRTKATTQNVNVNTLFSDFLRNSGLTDTLLELQAEEMEAEQERLSASKKSGVTQKASKFATASSLGSSSKQTKKSKVNDNAVNHQVEHHWEDQSVIDTLLDEQNKLIQQANSEHLSVSSAPQSVDNASMGSHHRINDTVDMTPTNTPPANPKKPNQSQANSHESSKTQAPVELADTSLDTNTNTDDILESFVTPDTLTQTSKPSAYIEPTIKFDVAEGDLSNHIEEMMPESNQSSDEARLDKVMPPIEDDEAFKSKSRAMQTAKHRKSLTPIPSVSILDKPDPNLKPSYSKEELEQLSELLEIKLQDFNVKAEVVNAIPGPVVTRFEVELAPGIKASKVTGISRDLARSLSMASLRVVEVIPGKPYIGIEVPNKKRQMVRLIELLTTEKYKDPNAQISMAMGKDIGGNPIITDLAKAPHMLVAGTTGSGKSVLVNSMLLSMLLKYKPNELRLILIDPKQLELANYNEIPHLLTPVVTDMNEAASSLSWCVAEMERRYQLMSLLKVRKLNEFNKKVIKAEQAGKPMIDPLWHPNDSVSIDQAPKLKTLPMIVIVADEFADMIMQVGKQAEELITRLAQKSRAAGIHLMLATQRPSVDVITGLIKANIPVRAALRVNSKVDSRTILDSGGAEDMLGNGDMLFLGPGQIEPERVHGAYVSDAEVNRVCDAWRERGAPDYIDNMASNFELASTGGGGNTSGEDDQLYDEAVAFVMETRKVSASSIQRKFSIGYNRAARIVDSMEEAGLVSPMGKSGKRELLM